MTNLGYDARTMRPPGSITPWPSGVQRAAGCVSGFFPQDAAPAESDHNASAATTSSPVHAKNDSYSTATFADVCGRPGSTRRHQLFQPGVTPGIHPTFQQFKADVRLQHRRQQHRAEHRRHGTPSERPPPGKMFGKDGDTVFRGYTRCSAATASPT